MYKNNLSYDQFLEFLSLSLDTPQRVDTPISKVMVGEDGIGNSITGLARSAGFELLISFGEEESFGVRVAELPVPGLQQGDGPSCMGASHGSSGEGDISSVGRVVG